MARQLGLLRVVRRFLAMFALILLAYVIGASAYGDARARNDVDVKALFEQSWLSPSPIEKAILRRRIVDAQPSSIYALFSSAWLADRDSQREEAIRLYRQCVKQAPDFLPCKLDLAETVNAPEDKNILQQLCATDPSFDDYSCFEYQMVPLARQKDQQAAEALFKQAELVATPAVVAYLKAYWLLNVSKNTTAASTLVEHALSQPGADSRLVVLWLDMQAPDQRLNPVDRKNTDRILLPVQHYIAQIAMSGTPKPRTASLLKALADKLLSAFHDRNGARQIFELAQQAYPTAELLESIHETEQDAGMPSWEAAVALLHQTQPDNFAVTAAFAEMQIPTNVDDANRTFQLAIQQSPTNTDRDAIRLRYAAFRAQWMLDFDGARALYTSLLNSHADRGDVFSDFYPMLLSVGDLPEAQSILFKYQNYREDRNSINLPWYENAERQLKDLTAFEGQEHSLPTSKFLLQWKDTFRDGNAVLPFDRGSAQITTPAKTQMALVANHLKRQSATDFYVGLAGSIDRTEDAGLAARRSGAVLAYLTDTLGVDRARLRINNDSNAGTALSRNGAAAVVVSVLGDLRHPQISFAGRLDASDEIAVSSDGTLFASGTRPVQIWDAGRRIKLRDIAEGRGSRFSPDGSKLAIISDDLNAIRIYDVASGQPVTQLIERDNIQNVSWGGQSDAIAYAAGQQLTVYSLRNNKRIAVRKLHDAIDQNRVVWLTNGLIATAQPWATKIQLWDDHALEPKQSLDGVDFVQAMAGSPDGRWLVAYDNHEHVTVFNTADWTSRQTTVSSAAHRITFSRNSAWMVLNNWDGKKSNSFTVMRLDNLKATRHTIDPSELDAEYDFSADGSTLYMASSHTLTRLSFPALDPIETIGADAPTGLGSIALPRRHQLITYDTAGISLWNVDTGFLSARWAIHATDIFASSAGDRVIGLVKTLSGKETDLYSLDLDSQQARLVGHVPFVVHLRAQSSKMFGIAGAPDYPATTREIQLQGTIQLYNFNTFKLISSFRVPLVTRNLYHGYAVWGGFTGFDIAPDGKTVAVSTDWGDGFGQGRTYSPDVRVYNAAGKLTATKTFPCDIKNVELNSDGIVADCDFGVYRFPSSDNVWSRLSGRNAGEWRVQDIAGASLRASPRALMLQNYRDEVLQRHEFPGNLASVSAFPEEGLVYALTLDNEIMALRLSDLATLATSFIRTDREWVTIVSNGRYVSSKGGAEAVRFTAGDRYVKLSDLGADLKDPDRVRSTLKSASQADAPPDVARFLAENKQSISIKNANELPNLQTGSAIINGSDVRISSAGSGQIYYSGDSQSALKDGANWLTVERQRFLLWKDETEINYYSPPYEKSYAVIAAIDRYDRPGLEATEYARLKNMVVNARALADSLVALGFDRKNIKTFYDEEATSTAIIAYLKQFQPGGKYEKADRLLFYFGGHGVPVGKTGFLVTYDHDPKKPNTNDIGFGAIRDFLSATDARQVLIALDSCGAGMIGEALGSGALGDGVMTELLNRRRKLRQIIEEADSQARNVLVATTEGKPALWEERGGLFTQALVMALKGGAQEQTGIIDFDDLARYVEVTVPQLAFAIGSTQQPKDFNASDDHVGKMLFVPQPSTQ